MNSDREIRKQFHSKFNDFKAPVPSDGWERLEATLNAESAGKVMSGGFRWRYVGAVAATLLILIGSLLFLNNPAEENLPIVSETKTTLEETTKSVEPVTKNDVLAEVEKEQLFADSYKPASSVSARVEERSIALLDSEQEIAVVNDIKQTDISNVDIKNDNESLFEPIMEEVIEISGADDILYAEHFSDNDAEKLIVSFSGRGGLSNYQQTANAPMTLRSASAPDKNLLADGSDNMALQNNSTAGLKSEMEHSQPVSFGITVSKELFEDLYIETGLVYSYLYSRTKSSSVASQESESQRLHYIGVPINLNYNIFNLRKLNVYASIGGMIEKDVYGEYRSNREGQSVESDLPSTAMVKDKISQLNPQFSVNAGVGLSYPIYNDLKLYGKIGGAYYFDAKNLHPTIYSDRKIVMDLSLGVRYEF